MLNFNGSAHSPFNQEHDSDGNQTWQVAHPDHALPIKVWGTREGVFEQHGAISQAIAIANHPIARAFVALMPDFHPGYGMPIGGVFAADGGVIPNAVGNDIGCGMMAFETDIEADSITRTQLEAIRLAIHQRVPVGNKSHAQPQQDELFYEGSDSPVADLGRTYPVVFQNWDRCKLQLGTLGHGNHFIELDRDQLTGKLWIMLHSGSRGLGEQIKAHYHKGALRLNRLWYSNLPTEELAFLPTGTREYESYMREMEWAMRWATANRHHMMSAIQDCLQHYDVEVPMDEETRAEREIETHHNYAAMENHFGRNFLIHRKGAVKAVGRVIIPGSMGTASYICEGLANPMSYKSCSHGAGRPRSRGDTNKLYTLERAKTEMQHVVFGVREGEFDEMPGAYKDIHEVIQLQSDLVRPLNVIEPLMVVKG